jgi:hypothetical protein
MAYITHPSPQQPSTSFNLEKEANIEMAIGYPISTLKLTLQSKKIENSKDILFQQEVETQKAQSKIRGNNTG